MTVVHVCRALGAALFAMTGCGSNDPPPADVHGTYTLSVTDGPSSCPLPGWTAGSTTGGIPIQVSQNGANASADVGGLGQAFLQAYCGNGHLDGSVSGSTIDLHLSGTCSLSSGSCAFTIDAHLVG